MISSGLTVPLFAAVLLIADQCGAFVPPAALLIRPSPPTIRLDLGTSRTSIHTPTMVMTGLPQKKKKSKLPQPKKMSWDEDLSTTVGKVLFLSLKDKARDMMVKGAEKRGLDWTGIVETLQVCC